MPDPHDPTHADLSFATLLAATRPGVTPAERPVVCVQGLGHVGSAMAVAVANARNSDGTPAFNVVGVELDSELGRSKVADLNAGRMPFAFTDDKLSAALAFGHNTGNLLATTDQRAYALASVVLVDVPFDVADINGRPHLPWDHFKSALRTIGQHINPGTLVLVETTVPPGACEKVAAPLLAECFRGRGLAEDGFLLAHSYERVMPGPQYYESIVNFWRVFAGHTQRAGDAAQAFLERVIDTERYPMTRLQSTTASETAKVLENSYRATNIAFVEEWGRFAESVGIDLFEIINAIRVRPTHNNLRQPGFGVGGYCLTKDPLMAKLAGQELFGLGLDFPFCTMAVKTNNAMPIVSLDYVDGALGGLSGKRILLMGVSYRPGVGDTRYSPSELFVREAVQRGAEVDCHDSLIDHWRELDMALPGEIPAPRGYDAVVFAVGHAEYAQLDVQAWLNGATPLIFDGNCVLSAEQRRAARDAGCDVRSIGRGERASAVGATT
ncbi:MAG: nucleotide sugar dehydrogenase [Phycisphaeraceae bacterium]